MRQSRLFTKTTKNISAEEKSLNAQLLTRGGFVDKLAAGIYTHLPLGLRVINKIGNIIREEMNVLGAQEILMPALQPKANWQVTGRWDELNVLFKLKGDDSKEYALGATHEEVVVPLLGKFIFSYKDLPISVYQIQTKFRNEKRAKSGILRGRQFLMKDLYSFHADEKDLGEFYEKIKESYWKIFERVGIKEKTYLTLASGGTFSKYSHEFQTVTDAGEDTIYICKKCHLSINKEILADINPVCPECQSEEFDVKKAIEVGNIFKLNTRFSGPFNLRFKDADGKEKIIFMGCFGIGLDRLMGTVVEICNDENGIVWPANIAPFQAHLILLKPDDKESAKEAENIYDALQKADIEVLFDDRNLSVGIKLKDGDLIGIPVRLVVSGRNKGKIEVKKRSEEKNELLNLNDVIKLVSGI
ncbi:MAG: aminoacyl--tRNA ligase-related protein [Patescibacteria group bacterium]|nr:prolyl-tRNA synthetase [Patescibacteria group bacterium]MBU4141723.1 prolyl-tRNA synthetase [Patescibacteria group bacterium]